MESDVTTSTENVPTVKVINGLGWYLPEGQNSYQRGFISGVRMCIGLTDTVSAIDFLGIGPMEELAHRRAVRDASIMLMATSALKLLEG